MLPFFSSTDIVVGIDEVGRGALAGPVVAGAVHFGGEFIEKYQSNPEEFPWLQQINDSKKLSKTIREDIYKKINETPGIFWSIGAVDAEVIDQINIAKATMLAMEYAYDRIADSARTQTLIIDGNMEPSQIKVRYPNTQILPIIKGDTKFIEIAAASIMAKVHRDNLMTLLSEKEEFSHYGWNTNVGYGSKKHLEAIDMQGMSALHRKSFLTRR